MEIVVYFSNNRDRKKYFWNFCKRQGICYLPKFSFKLLGNDPNDPYAPKTEYKDPRELINIIEECEFKDSLHVIIDYISWAEFEKYENYSTVFRDIIMCYPEVQFHFDETFTSNNKEFGEFNYTDYLLGPSNPLSEIVDKDWHKFVISGNFADIENQFILLLKGRNNLFDASNLRYAIKKKKFKTLKVNPNFSKLSDSRFTNPAMVVEEEYHQNMFNSYCLYANGFRVFPVTTATELLDMDKKGGGNSKTLVVRDYDLQFVDEDKANIEEKRINEVDWCRTDFVRGAKKIRSDGHYELLEKDNYQCWKSFEGKNTFFVSKGGEGLRIKLRKNKWLQKRQDHMKQCRKKLKIRGLEKPLEGIYESFQHFHVVKQRYKETRYKPWKEEFKIIVTRIEKDGHSCSLDIYGIARSMVHRAEKYYHDKKYRLAALVAGESIEVLNGFHPSLMKRAYYIQAVSENAMSMSLLGGEESKLVDDLIFRFKKIKEDINRMIPDRKDRANVLNSIYNDCRVFCRQVEFFEAADEALSFMVHENEGMNVWDCIKYSCIYLWVKMKKHLSNKVKEN